MKTDEVGHFQAPGETPGFNERELEEARVRGIYSIAPKGFYQGVLAGVVSDVDHEPRPYQAPDLGADEYWPPGALRHIYVPLMVRESPKGARPSPVR